MTDYAPNFTNRLKIGYSVLGKIHHATYRFGNTPTAYVSGMGDEVADLLNALTNVRFISWHAVDAEYAQAGSDIFLPVTLPSIDDGVVNLTGTGLVPLYLDFQGKSTLGNRASTYLFGVNFSPDVAGSGDETNYRIEEGEETTVDNGLAVLDGVTFMTAIDGSTVFWHRYANVGVHAHYQRKARS